MTRSQTEKTELAQLTEAVASLSTAFTNYKQSQDQKHDSYLTTFQVLQNQLQELKNPPTNIETLKPPKLTLQQFDGSNPLEWVFQAEQFFSHYSIALAHRLAHASCYMMGDALGWFQWLHNSNLLTTWEEFTRALELRFGPSSFENHQQALFKLQQSGTVADYQREFERLCNRVVGLPQSAILDCFISGLLPEIQHELAILGPTSISQAIGLAKLVETKLQASAFPTSKPSFFPTQKQFSPKPFTQTLPFSQ